MFFPVSGIECHPLVPVLAAMGISFVTSMAACREPSCSCLSR